eukprot:evm.model.scf_214.2 EVM.evm.TU.scf_214.2   scf_214:42241-46475(-)
MGRKRKRGRTKSKIRDQKVLENVSESFTYHQDTMVALKEAVDRVVSEETEAFASDRTGQFVAWVETMPAVHSRPFDVKNFYPQRRIWIRFEDWVGDWVTKETLLWFIDRCLNCPLLYGEDPLFEILLHTFESVANGTDGGTFPDGYASIVQNVASEIQAWRMIDDDEVALGKVHRQGRNLVYKGQWEDEMVAVKSRLTELDHEDVWTNFFREAAFHASLAHPNVVHLYGVTPSGNMVMELGDGNLEDVCLGKSLEWQSKRSLLQQASAGLTYLHSLNEPVVHGNISSHSFVTFGTDPGNCTVKLVDTENIAGRVCKHLQQLDRDVASSLQYNHNMMNFLAQQMAKARTILEDMPKDPAVACRAQQWRVSWSQLDDAVRMGCCLIRRHSKDFDLQKFYTVEEAQQGVTRVCELLRDVVVRWNLDVQIDTTVPDAVAAEDDGFLHSCLAYLFDEGTRKCGTTKYSKALSLVPFLPKIMSFRRSLLSGGKLPMTEGVKDWLQVKNRLDKHLSRLKMVNDNDINIGQPIESGRSVVYHARWKGRDVAVKRLRCRGARDMNPQEFAKFYTEAFIQASLSHPYIVRLLAVSKSGLMVMELGCCDLETLYKEAHLDWGTKYRFLTQVAEALEYMHSREPSVVHCDVKSPNILIFGDKSNLESCTAKLSDFGISIKETSTASVTVRRPGGTPHWMAPEIYDEVHPTKAADVFSFGIVMYEIASQMPPYGGRGTPCASIYHMKCAGQPACNLPNDCPFVLRELMEKCCSVNPCSRPSMNEVILTLSCAEACRLIHAHLSHDQPTGSQSDTCQVRSGQSQGNKKLAVNRFSPPAVPGSNHQHFVKICIDSYSFQTHLKHPLIARLLEQSESGLVVGELPCSDLGTLCEEAHLDWRAIYRFLAQVAEALEYMHSRVPAMVHCDVRSSNILIFGDGSDLENCTAKLSGLAMSVKEASTEPVPVRPLGGATHWLAPEMYDEVHPSPEADVFSFGVMMYEVVSRTPPYGSRGTSSKSIYRMKCKGRPPCRLPDDCPSNLRNLMEGCCSFGPSSRPTMEQVLKFFRGCSILNW